MMEESLGDCIQDLVLAGVYLVIAIIAAIQLKGDPRSSEVSTE